MIVVVWGVSGCGKTTVAKLLAKKLDWQFLDADDFHSTENIEKMRQGRPLNDKDRKPWLDEIAQQLMTINQSGASATLACSALKLAYRDLLGINEKTVRSVLLHGDQQAIQQRLENRQHEFMNKDLLNSQFQTLEADTTGIKVSIQQSPSEICHEIRRQLQI
ncbi:MAG: gluconokinase [Pseudomonadales bacterium]|jgi:gluconokinase|tara:strand:+ start:3954 stop:4439 length:486 start_codon:yes stop_codon:yes gene_type:complete